MLQRLKPYINLNSGVLLVALLITIGWVWGTIEAIQKNFALQQRVDTLTQEIAFHELENETLEFHKKYYQTNEYVELSVRERLNKANPGEKVVILPANTVAVVEEHPVRTQPLSERSNMEQWMYFLFGKKAN